MRTASVVSTTRYWENRRVMTSGKETQTVRWLSLCMGDLEGGMWRSAADGCTLC
jgi:hypothetical protein